jgi:hypothetical protein
VRLRAARSMPPVISTIVMSGFFGAASARVNVRIFYQAPSAASQLPWPAQCPRAALSVAAGAIGGSAR